jgi:hypothetical protein
MQVSVYVLSKHSPHRVYFTHCDSLLWNLSVINPTAAYRPFHENEGPFDVTSRGNAGKSMSVLMRSMLVRRPATLTQVDSRDMTLYVDDKMRRGFPVGFFVGLFDITVFNVTFTYSISQTHENAYCCRYLMS